MKPSNIHIGLALIASLLNIQFINAQTTDSTATDTAYIERKINIEKEYMPEIKASTRTQVEYTIQEQNVKKADIIYSGYASDVQPRPQFYPLEPLKQKILNRKTPKKGYAALGYGYPIVWLAQLYYPAIATNSNYMDIALDHRGFLLGKKQLIDTDFELKYKHNFENGHRIIAEANYSNLYYTYYGNHTMDSNTVYTLNDRKITIDSLPLHQSIHNVSALIGAQSTKNLNGWTYTATLNYDMTMLQYIGTTQHTITLDGLIGKKLGNNNIVLGVNFENYFYNKPSKTNFRNNGILALAPAYQLNWKGLNIHAGVRFFLSFNKGLLFNAMPDVKVDYNIGRLMNIYAAVTGDYRSMSLAATMEECRYIDPTSDLQYNAYTPIKALIGFNIKPLHGMLLNFYADYAYTNNDHFFLNRHFFTPDNQPVMSPMFTTVFSNSQHFDFNLRWSYNHKDNYYIYTSAIYHLWYTENQWQTPWHKPEFEWEIGTIIRPIKPLTINANFYLGTGYKAAALTTTGQYAALKMTNHYDLNIGATYKFNKSVAIFAELNNLLGFAPSLRYQEWYGYDNIGFNCLVGVKIGF